ncbi:MAG: YbaN family protein [Xanthomonadaceae bacterium]|nr:YbaN family protein [Xanthomonadaceae bacterium]
MKGRGRAAKWTWLLLAYLCLALGLIGVVLPGLPTTPFILVAAWAAARGSRRLHRWLFRHPLFGPMVRDWRREGAVSRRAKWSASAAMVACAGVLTWAAPRFWMAAIAIAIMAVVSLWLWFRPEPRGGSLRSAVGPADVADGRHADQEHGR